MLDWLFAIGFPACLGAYVAGCAAEYRRKAKSPDWQESAYGFLAGWGVAVVLRWLGWVPAGFQIVILIGSFLLLLAAVVSFCFSTALAHSAKDSPSLWKTTLRRHLRRLRKAPTAAEATLLSKWWSDFGGLCFVVSLIVACSYQPQSADLKPSPESAPVPATTGLTLQQLNLTSPIVMVQWSDDDDLAGTDRGGGQGSTCPIAVANGKLLLITNRHCLWLEQLAAADSQSDGRPDVASYDVSVRFVTGTSRRVDRVRVPKAGLRGIDLAVLEVDAKGLQLGVDFVLLQPFDDKATALTIGEETVAVGTPRGWEATHTFGRISQFRDGTDGKTTFIQTDAPLNPGNSGGPLFLVRNDRHFWIGVNTFISGSDNLGFAIHAKHCLAIDEMWEIEATKHGVVQLLNSFGYKAIIYP